MPNKHHTTASESVSRSNSYDDASMQDEQPPGYDEVTQSSVVVACTNGRCLGINLHTGATIWVSRSTIIRLTPSLLKDDMHVCHENSDSIVLVLEKSFQMHLWIHPRVGCISAVASTYTAFKQEQESSSGQERYPNQSCLLGIWSWQQQIIMRKPILLSINFLYPTLMKKVSPITPIGGCTLFSHEILLLLLLIYPIRIHIPEFHLQEGKVHMDQCCICKQRLRADNIDIYNIE